MPSGICSRVAPSAYSEASTVTGPSGGSRGSSFLSRRRMARRRLRRSARMVAKRSPTMRRLILGSLLLATFVINLDITIVNVALPSLVRELHASNSQLQWIVDAYSLVFAALVLGAGNLSDRRGRRGVLLAGLAVFGLASFAGGLTATAGQLIVARGVMGLGAALIFPATLSLLTNVF